MNQEIRAKIDAELAEDLKIKDDREFLLKSFERIENDKEGYAFYAKALIKRLNSEIRSDLRDVAYVLNMYLFSRHVDIFHVFFGYQAYFDILDDFGDNVYFEKSILKSLKEELKRIKMESTYEDIRLIYEIREEIFNMVENRGKNYESDMNMLEREIKGIRLYNERNKPLPNEQMQERVLAKVKLLDQQKCKRNEKGTEL